MINKDILKSYSRFLKSIGRFFDEQDYLEVRTPILSPGVIPESSIEVFQTCFKHPYQASQELFLLPSPELWMKILLSRDIGPIYQIGPCFRNGEQSGPYHNPEFTMLEWYTPGADYYDSVDLCEKLIAFVTKELNLSTEYWKPPFKRITMEEAFDEILGLDLNQLQEESAIESQVKKLGLLPSANADWEELFNQIFVNFIEPALPREKPLFLMDYPDKIPCLAKKIAHKPCYQRWELYAKGIELGNCFTEEDDYLKLEELLESEQIIKNKALVPTIYPKQFMNAVKQGFPGASGTAMGLERLFMVLYNLRSIEEVIIFPYSRFLNGEIQTNEEQNDQSR